MSDIQTVRERGGTPLENMTRTQALKALGNAVVPQQGAAALGSLLKLAEVAA